MHLMVLIVLLIGSLLSLFIVCQKHLRERGAGPLIEPSALASTLTKSSICSSQTLLRLSSHFLLWSQLEESWLVQPVGKMAAVNCRPDGCALPARHGASEKLFVSTNCPDLDVFKAASKQQQHYRKGNGLCLTQRLFLPPFGWFFLLITGSMWLRLHNNT